MSQNTISQRWPTRFAGIQRMGGYRLTTCWYPNGNGRTKLRFRLSPCKWNAFKVNSTPIMAG